MKYTLFLILALAVTPAFADIFAFDADHDKMLSETEKEAYLNSLRPKDVTTAEADKYLSDRATEMQVLLEWREMAGADFTRIDKNKDGKVDKKEFIAAYPQAAGNENKLAESYTRDKFVTLQLSSLADAMEKFGITEAELDARAKSVHEQRRKYEVNIASYDADKNGVVTLNELKAMHVRMFSLIPNAGDGILTRAEYTGWQQDTGFQNTGAFPDTAKVAAKFDAMDTNHDGKLTASEYATHEAADTLKIFSAMAKQDFSHGIPLKKKP